MAGRSPKRLRRLSREPGFDVVVLAHPELFGFARETARELGFPLVETGDDYEQLYAKIIDTAHKAGEDIPEYAYIPWS